MISGAAVAYWLERRIRDRNEDFEREFDSPLTHTLSKVRDAQWIMYNHRSNQLSLLSGYPEPAATQIRNRGLRPARDGYKSVVVTFDFPWYPDQSLQVAKKYPDLFSSIYIGI